jgi:hypothetical protein
MGDCYVLHRNISASLRKLKGRITFSYCTKCLEKIIFRGKPNYDENTTYRLIFECSRCYSRYAAILKEFDEYPAAAWICRCGKERTIIKEEIL